MRKSAFFHRPYSLKHERASDNTFRNHRQHITLAAITFGIGFSPIIAFALALMERCTLPTATLLLVVPSLLLALIISFFDAHHGKLMLSGFLMGIIAVTCYDCVRLPLTMAGLINDFIPKIGEMLGTRNDFHFLIGYLWRYLGNGGGMGMAFVAAFILLSNCLNEQQHHRLTPRMIKKIALAFGTMIWTCLIATLLLAPNGQQMMFPITSVTLLISLIGHLIYGFTLGYLLSAWQKR